MVPTRLIQMTLAVVCVILIVIEKRCFLSIFSEIWKSWFNVVQHKWKYNIAKYYKYNNITKQVLGLF
jgi:hypothetical protein